MENNQNKKKNFENAAMKTLAVLGLLAVLGVGLWGSVALVRVMPKAFSAIGKTISTAAVSLSSIFIPAENLALTSSAATVNSGESFTLTFAHTGKHAPGGYSLSLPCRDGVAVDFSTTETGAYTPVNCGATSTPLTMGADNGVIRMIALSTKNRYTDVPFTLSFTTESGSVITDSVTVTVVNNKVADNSTTTGSTTSNSNSGTTGSTGTHTTPGNTTTDVRPIPTTNPNPVNNPNGQADLAVTFVDFGYIDSATNAFVSSTTPSTNPSMKLAVKFSIANIGTKATGDNWQFAANLPTMPNYIYQSDAQRILAPGDRIEYTLAFDEAIRDQSLLSVTVNADINNRVNERNKDNNLVTKQFTVVKTK